MEKQDYLQHLQKNFQQKLDFDLNNKSLSKEAPAVGLCQKNRVWSHEQHLLYLVFLDLNKDRTKSKLVRHSNNFFKEMSSFLHSKTDIQCRSHHHKYEEKYKYPYRIIKQERAKLEEQGLSYSSCLEKFTNKVVEEQRFRMGENLVKQEEKFPSKNMEVASVECQTDISGVRTTIITQEEYERRYLYPPAMCQVVSPYPMDPFTMQGMMGFYQ